MVADGDLQVFATAIGMLRRCHATARSVAGLQVATCGLDRAPPRIVPLETNLCDEQRRMLALALARRQYELVENWLRQARDDARLAHVPMAERPRRSF